MAIPVRSDLDFGGVARVKNLPAPLDPSDAARKADVDAATPALSWKSACRVATITDVHLDNPGSSIDDVTLAVGDRVLVKDQSNQTENGIYIWNGASTAMTRAPDAETPGEMRGAIVTVLEGTVNGGTTWRQQETLGTNIVWVPFNPVPEISGAWTAESYNTGATKTRYDAFVAPLNIPGFIKPKGASSISFIIRVTVALGAAGTIGLYDRLGHLVCKSADGAVTTSAGIKSITVTVPSYLVIGPGTYYVALTWNSSAGAVAAANPYNIILRCGTITLTDPATLPPNIDLSTVVAGYMLLAYVGT